MGVTGRAGALVQNLRPKRFASHIVVVLTLSVTVGIALALPAHASTPRPVITKTQATFTIPVSNGDSWRLRLWSSGTLEGVDIATAGTLTVPVPATADCAFQADISVAQPGSKTYYYYYPGTRATVPGCGPVSTIAGHIYACGATGVQTTTEIPGGTLAATGPQTLASQPNPLSATPVLAGSYTMMAGAPSGFVFVACGGSATVGSSGSTASESVVVPSGGSAAGVFYAVAVSTAAGGGSNPPPSAANPTPVGTIPSIQPAAATKASSSALAFTGMNTGPLLFVGIVLLALGTLAMRVSRRRRFPLDSERP